MARWIDIDKQQMFDIQESQSLLRNENFSLALNTSQQIENMRVINWESKVHRDLIELLQKFGPNVRKFSFVEGSASLKEIKEYLELLPKITWLNLNLTNELTEDIDFPGGFPQIDLKELRELKVDCHNRKDFLLFLALIPSNVLTKLKLLDMYSPWDELESFLYNQKNINQLAIGFDVLNSFFKIPDDLLNGLALKRLTVADFKLAGWDVPERDFNSLVIMSFRQRDLTHLQMCGIRLNDKMLAAIVKNLPNLEALTIHTASLTPGGIKVIENLQKLKELTIENPNRGMGKNGDLRSFAELDNSRLEVLEFMHPFHVSSGLIVRIARSAPNLKKLFIESVIEFKVVLAILQNFNTVESLVLLKSDEDGHNIDMMLEDGWRNKHLEKLCFNMCGPHKFCHIKKLFKSFPNLKELELSLGAAHIRPIVKDLSVMLQRWQFLTHLTLSCFKSEDGSHLIMNDLNVFLDHVDQLKFIAIRNITLTKHERQIVREWYRDIFSVIEFNTENCSEPNEVNMILATDYKIRNESDSWLEDQIVVC